jgi:hypothetical protein
LLPKAVMQGADIEDLVAVLVEGAESPVPDDRANGAVQVFLLEFEAARVEREVTAEAVANLSGLDLREGVVIELQEVVVEEGKGYLLCQECLRMLAIFILQWEKHVIVKEKEPLLYNHSFEHAPSQHCCSPVETNRNP